MLHLTSQFSVSEPPVTADEKVIHDLMKRYFDALRLHTADDLRLIFYDDASIESFSARRMVSLEEHIEAMRRLLPRVRNVLFQQLLVRIETKSAATVYGFTRYDTDAIGSWWERVWKFVKIGDRWGIVRAHCNRT